MAIRPVRDRDLGCCRVSTYHQHSASLFSLNIEPMLESPKKAVSVYLPEFSTMLGQSIQVCLVTRLAS